MALTIIAGPTIAAGASLSSAIDCSNGRLMRIAMPMAWTQAVLSFQISNDGVIFHDAYRVDGTEITLRVQAGRMIVIQAAEATSKNVQFTGAHLKFRSGEMRAPVPQAAERTFAVAIET